MKRTTLAEMTAKAWYVGAHDDEELTDADLARTLTLVQDSSIPHSLTASIRSTERIRRTAPLYSCDLNFCYNMSTEQPQCINSNNDVVSTRDFCDQSNMLNDLKGMCLLIRPFLTNYYNNNINIITHQQYNSIYSMVLHELRDTISYNNVEQEFLRTLYRHNEDFRRHNEDIRRRQINIVTIKLLYCILYKRNFYIQFLIARVQPHFLMPNLSPQSLSNPIRLGNFTTDRLFINSDSPIGDDRRGSIYIRYNQFLEHNLQILDVYVTEQKIPLGGMLE